jgi:hypothetical protein
MSHFSVSPKHYPANLVGYKKYLKDLGIEYRANEYNPFSITFSEFKSIDRRTEKERLKDESMRIRKAVIYIGNQLIDIQDNGGSQELYDSLMIDYEERKNQLRIIDEARGVL